MSIICCSLFRIVRAVVIDAIKCCVSELWRYFLSAGIEKYIKYNQDQSSIMLLLEHNFRHNAFVLMVTLKSIVLKFSSIFYLTLQSIIFWRKTMIDISHFSCASRVIVAKAHTESK